MQVEKSMHNGWLSNTYLVYSGPGSKAIFIDAGGPVKPLLGLVEEQGLTPTHILLTHHHGDHIAELELLRVQFPDAKVASHASEAGAIGEVDQLLEPGSEFEAAGFKVKAIHTPGHTSGMLNFMVDEEVIFTGDTLFKGSVGGVRAPGHTTYDDLKSSIMDTLMTLPHSTVIYPGHTEQTTVGAEWEENPFIRIWRGVDNPETSSCKVSGQEAELVLAARDYDGGTKVWVRWPAGSDDIVPGSAVSY